MQQLVLDDNDEVVSKTVALIPDVDQSFGGTFSPDTPSPDRENPPCEERELPWVGNAIPVVDGVPQGSDRGRERPSRESPTGHRSDR